MVRPVSHYLRLCFLVFVTTVSCAASAFSVENKSYQYEPETVILSGVVERQAFPGRPGYESIKNGDEVESGLYLRLSYPIDVIARKNADDHNSNSEKEVRIVQLVWDSDPKGLDLSDAVGKELAIKGSLFHAFTAHHHARVLMSVEKVVRK